MKIWELDRRMRPEEARPSGKKWSSGTDRCRGGMIDAKMDPHSPLRWTSSASILQQIPLLFRPQEGGLTSMEKTQVQTCHLYSLLALRDRRLVPDRPPFPLPVPSTLPTHSGRASEDGAFPDA